MPYQFKEEIASRIGREKNALICVAGETGSGKSYSAISLAEQIDPEFTVDRIVYSIEDFFDLLHSGTLKKGSCVVLDESGVLVPTREWYSLTNRVLNYILQTFRQDNLVVFFCVPDLSFIDSQTRKLFHYFLQPIGINKSEQTCYCKVLRVLPNPRTGEVWWVHPRYVEDDTLQVINSIAIKIPTVRLRTLYEKKKLLFRRSLGNRVLMELNMSKVKKDGRKPTDITDMVQYVVDHREQFERMRGSRPFLNAVLIDEHFKKGVSITQRIKRIAEEKLYK